MAYGCERNSVSCGRGDVTSALMDIAVDWSDSGINVSGDVTRSGTSYDVGVHRVSLRFFVLDDSGGTSGVFERYIETSIYEGSIQIPVGRYAIVAMNESSADSYWSGSLEFENTDDYATFAAVLPTSSDSNSDVSASAAKPLAAWSLGEFEVTSNMAALSRGVVTSMSGIVLTDYELEQMSVLKGIKMLPRTRTMNVSVSASNLGSVQKVTATVGGFSTRVYMVSGDTHEDSVSHTFELDTWSYSDATRADNSSSGVVSGSRICLGHSAANDQHSDYALSLEVYQNDGKRFVDDDQLSAVSVGSQVLATTDGLSDYEISHEVAFDYVSDYFIDVDGWVDGGEIELN
ncbi:MAG: DUF5119 domain-containing protein [Rikenellaceae bacterium]